MSAALVSIVMPCFNAERWLRRAIGSVLAQTHREFELIAIDDGSSDRTGVILEEFSRRDSRVRVCHLENNGGIVAALNRGLEMATGAFVARMDADDVCLPQRLTVQLRFLEENGVDICGSWFAEFGQGPPRTVKWPHRAVDVRASMLFQNSICHPTLLARKSVFDHLSYREEYRLAEDYDLLSRAMSQFSIANVPEVLLRYRRHPAQATQSSRAAMERVTAPLRIQALAAAGFAPDPAQARAHHMIRAPESIRDMQDLVSIEDWLLSLVEAPWAPSARKVVASQWIRACIRAAPLGRSMLGAFNRSPLTTIVEAGPAVRIDLTALALLKLDYLSMPFAMLRRFGLAA